MNETTQQLDEYRTITRDGQAVLQRRVAHIGYPGTEAGPYTRDQNRGIYQKFIVTRTDGKSSPGEKHHECEYFVLDISHDPHAKAALLAYAESCKAEYPLLAHDVWAMAILAQRDAETAGSCA